MEGSLERQVNSRGRTLLGGISLLSAIAQSFCTAVVTISGIRVAIGLSALAAAGGIYAPAREFHQDSVRTPMLVIAVVGALANLAVLARVYQRRSNPADRGIGRNLSATESRSEKLQIGMAILTLVLVCFETWTHPIVHRPGTESPVTRHANL
jgi:hypothetical protein